MNKFLETNNRLEQLDQFLRQKRTGTAPKLADRMNICERTLHSLFDKLRELGAKIGYNRLVAM